MITPETAPPGTKVVRTITTDFKPDVLVKGSVWTVLKYTSTQFTVEEYPGIFLQPELFDVYQPTVDSNDYRHMTKDEYTELVCDELDRMKHLIRSKNADYSDGDDPFANFRSAEDYDVSAEKSIFFRLQDKWQRIKAFIKHGTLQVKDDPPIDAFRDNIGYSCLMIGLLTERKNNDK